MSIVVAYPVEIRKYQVSIGRSRAEIQLEGVEAEAGSDGKVRRVGNITFGDPDAVGDEDFITRGGFLKMDRPLELFAGIMDLLRHERPVFLHDDGTLTTLLEPAGEERR